MSITIKQAFQKLAMVTGAALKNPWFIGRNLNQAFAEIADNVVDASGDKVTVTQTLTEGTEIGSIKVNNDTTTLYAPAGGGVGEWKYLGKNTSFDEPEEYSEIYFVMLAGHQPSVLIPKLAVSDGNITYPNFASGYYRDSSNNACLRIDYDRTTHKFSIGIRYVNGETSSANCAAYYR